MREREREKGTEIYHTLRTHLKQAEIRNRNKTKDNIIIYDFKKCVIIFI